MELFGVAVIFAAIYLIARKPLAYALKALTKRDNEGETFSGESDTLSYE